MGKHSKMSWCVHDTTMLFIFFLLREEDDVGKILKMKEIVADTPLLVVDETGVHPLTKE